MFNAGPSLADIAAVTGNRNNDGGWCDGNGWWVLIILFALFGGWGRGGNWGGNGDGGSCCAPATCADLQRGFDNQTTQMRFNGIDQGICSLGYDNAVLTNGVNTNIMQTGFGIQNAITQQGIAEMQQANALQAQLAECCCENRAAIAQVRYDMATDTCAVTTAINGGFAQLDRTINDKFCELEMRNMQRQIDEQQSLIQSLNLAQSQANQTQTLIDRLRPCPEPAYITCNPWATNGTSYNGCCGVNGFNGGCC